ncbi:MAG: hypothetical protein ACOH2C_20840, partial [Clostridium sp.]
MKKIKPWIKLILGTFIIITLVVGGTFTYTFYKLSKINTTTILKTDEDLGIKPNVTLKEEIPIKEKLPLKEEVPIKQVESNKIINIAFFGVDRRTPNEPSRSDSIMILSVDEVHKKIKISS